MKAVPKAPIAPSLKAHSFRTASPTAPSICRSKKFIVLAANKTHSVNHTPARSCFIGVSL